MSDNTRIRYEVSEMWGKKYHENDAQRARAVCEAVPDDVRTVLEVGCGDGLVTRALKKAGHDPVVTDLSRSALAYVTDLPAVQSTIEHLPFVSAQFDLVCASEVLEHIPEEMYSRVLAEISRVCARYVLVSVPYNENLEWSFARCEKCGCVFHGAYHIRSFNERRLEKLLGDFRCIELRAVVPLIHPDRTTSVELWVRHRLAREYMYYGRSVRCPVCRARVDRAPRRNAIGWIAAAMRYAYRAFFRKKLPLWYVALYQRCSTEKARV
jgi:SAM-dependent methyltransferase